MANGKGDVVIKNNGERVYLAHHLTTLHNLIVPRLAVKLHNSDFANETTVGLMCGYLSFASFNAADFNIAYAAVIAACDSDDGLKSYKSKLDKAFKADPRYKSSSAVQ